MYYDHLSTESKWRKFWQDRAVYATADTGSDKPKYYVLDMFPYPSGAGLHVGHPRGYIASDVFARFKRMSGFNVLHPMGFDSFGLPAEQYAIKTGNHPGPYTDELVVHYKQQLENIGFSYDWSREVSTHKPEYYKWTQWIFLQLFNSWYNPETNKTESIDTCIAMLQSTDPKWSEYSELDKQNILMNYRIAYQGYAEVNWCPELGTVLANDEIVTAADGSMVSERGEYPVVRKSMRQWFMRISAYADRLLSDLDGLDWPESIKSIQRNWIGRSEGAEIDFKLSTGDVATVFTTRADTLFGAFAIIIAPEHSLVQQLLSSVSNQSEVLAYIEKAKATAEDDRINDKNEKTGVQLMGIHAINPATGEEIPVWLADFVLAGYGTGAVFADMHDERDYAFAQKYNLPMKNVLAIPAETIPEGNKIRRDGVTCIIKNNEGKYLALKYNNGQFGFPTGGIEVDENIFDSAIRETREESGYEVVQENAKHLFSFERYYEMGEDWRHRITHVVYFDLKGGKFVGQDIQEGESQFEIFWFTESEMQEKLSWRADNQIFAWYLSGEKNNFTGHGKLIQSGDFNDLSSEEARKQITQKFGRPITKFKMRDAIFARQRYWGEPIPLQHVAPEDVQPKISLNFYKQSVWDRINSKQKTIESRALNPEEPNRYFGDVGVGDYIEFINKNTNQRKIVKVTSLKIYKNIEELFADKENLYKVVSQENDTLEKIKQGYAALSDGYLDKIQTNGLITWQFEEVTIIKELSEKDLPLTLPELDDFAPAGNGESPLSKSADWVSAGYETNTMPGWAGSSWYFLRYMDPTNANAFASRDAIDYWRDVDMYVGGAEHATGHLLYSRFWHKALYDLGYVPTAEPFRALRNQGMIAGTDGRKMSKRWGNVINPDDVVAQLGADTLRVYESFMGPFESHLPWSTDGIVGSRRFIERVYKLAHSEKVSNGATDNAALVTLHKTIKKVTEDINNFAFNTAISAMMIAMNEFEKSDSINRDDFAKFLQTLAPFAPFMTEDLWHALYPEESDESIHTQPWPQYDPALLVADTVTIGVQVNGKVRGEITISPTADQETAMTAAMELESVQKWITGDPKKVVYVPGKILNIIV